MAGQLLCPAHQRPDATAGRPVGDKQTPPWPNTRRCFKLLTACSVPPHVSPYTGPALPALTGTADASASRSKESGQTGIHPEADLRAFRRFTATTVSDQARQTNNGCSHVGSPFLTPNLLAVTQVSAGRTIQTAHAGTPSTFEKTMDQNVWGQLPQIVIDSRYGFTIGNPSRFGPGSIPMNTSTGCRSRHCGRHRGPLSKAGRRAPNRRTPAPGRGVHRDSCRGRIVKDFRW